MINPIFRSDYVSLNLSPNNKNKTNFSEVKEDTIFSGKNIVNQEFVPTKEWLDTYLRLQSITKPTTLNPRKKVFYDNKIQSFAPSTRETMRDKEIEKEKNHLSRPIEERTKYNTQQLKAAGVSERDVKKYLTYDGHVTMEGKKILREKGKSYK